MNSKIAIPIIIVIIIVIVGIIGITNQEITENEIEKPWITSGPFSIEVQEYNLGEKIFMNARNIPIDVKGEVLIFRPTLIQFISPMDGSDGLNKFEGISKDLVSKKKKYLAIQFDGKNKQDFNKYFEPKLSKWKNICSVNDLVGEWVIVFYGTQYKEIHFKILNQTSSWDERTFEAVC